MMGGEENHSIAGEIEGTYDGRRGGDSRVLRYKFWVTLLYINLLQNTDFYGYDFFLEVFISYSRVELSPWPALVHQIRPNETYGRLWNGLLSWLSQEAVIRS